MAEKAIFEVRTLSELHAKEGSMGVQNTARVSRHRKQYGRKEKGLSFPPQKAVCFTPQKAVCFTPQKAVCFTPKKAVWT